MSALIAHRPAASKRLAQLGPTPRTSYDWSSSPLIALYFAVEPFNAPNPNVYIYDAALPDEFWVRSDRTLTVTAVNQIPPTMILRTVRHSQRVVAQSGWSRGQV